MTLRFATKSVLLNVVAILLCLNTSGQIFSCLAFFYAGGLACRSPGGCFRDVCSCDRSRSLVCPVGLFIADMAVFVASQMADWELLLTYKPLLLFCLSCRTVPAASAQKLVEAAGNMTYSSYLLHFPIQLAIALGFALSGRSVPFYDSWFFGMFVLATLLASHLSYRYFEAPAQTLLRSRLLPKRGIAARAFAIVSVDHTRPRQAD